ncbi:MAG: activator of Hsp90 ATPase 1 family [Planctomycetota bacterium]|nr:MAG: activator of Hsp90 ATPase 1 family [Planctomycetota bacterium]
MLKNIAGAARLRVEAATAAEALEEVYRRVPALRFALCDDSGELRMHVLCFVNDRSTRDIGTMDVPLRDGDEIAILQAVSGGSGAGDREIVSTRAFDAPRDRVFNAWTDPVLLAQWWGPKGFTNTFHEFDPKPGGHWRFVMHGPDGKDWENHSVFVEIAKPERIVFDHLSPHHGFRVTATLAERAGKTELTFRMVFESARECTEVRSFVVVANEQNFDRLEAVLTCPGTEATEIGATPC